HGPAVLGCGGGGAQPAATRRPTPRRPRRRRADARRFDPLAGPLRPGGGGVRGRRGGAQADRGRRRAATAGRPVPAARSRAAGGGGGQRGAAAAVAGAGAAPAGRRLGADVAVRTAVVGNLLRRLEDWWQRSRRRLGPAVPFEVTCTCGQVLRGVRQARYQA